MRTLLPPCRISAEPQKDALGESPPLRPVSADVSRSSRFTDPLSDEAPLLPRVWQDFLPAGAPAESHGRAPERALCRLQHLSAALPEYSQLPAAPGLAPQGCGPLPSGRRREQNRRVLGLGSRSGLGDGWAEQAGSASSVSYSTERF